MGDHHRFVPPIVQSSEEFSGRGDGFHASRGELALRDTVGTGAREPLFVEVIEKIIVATITTEDADRGPLEQVETSGHRLLRDPARADGTGGDLVVLGAPQDDILVSVVLRGGTPDLRPLPTQEGDYVGIARVARHGIALPDTLHRFGPVRGGDAFGMVVDRPEVERRAIAGVIAGVGWWMGPFALQDREARHESIGGEGRVDMQIAEENLFFRGSPQG